jgi:cytochrome c oxidase subunit 2
VLRVFRATALPWVAGLSLALPSCSGPPPDPGPLQLRIVGEEFEWWIRYAGPDESLDTADDLVVQQNFHVPEDARVEIELQSRDYLYGFRIPALGVNEVAVPDLPMFARIEAPVRGSHALRGDQMCGYAHESLIGEVVVEPRSAFDRWFERQKEGDPR